jgi:hypothetical protein
MSHRRVFVEGLDRHIVLGGCKLSRHEPAGPKLRDFIHAGAAYPTSPSTCDYTAKAMSVITNIEGNDTWGDCVFAEDAHYVAVTTGNANTLFSYTPTLTLADYSAETGFNQNDPNTDQGADPIADLNYRVQKGYADGSKDVGWALVDCSNWAEFQYAMSTFGNVKLWFGIPDSIVNSMPNASGFVWDITAGAADQNNGHCIGTGGYNPPKIDVVAITDEGALVMTWGMLGLVTKAALAAWFVSGAGGGAAVRVSQDWVNKNSGQTPSGLNVAALYTAFNMYFGGKLVVPTPAPVPTPPGPAPAPTTGVTAAQAISWAQSGIAPNSWLLTRQQALTGIATGITKHWPKS